jgi:microcystin-dependent protein
MKQIILLIAFMMFAPINAFAQTDPPEDEFTGRGMVYPFITFTREFQYTYTPTGGTETTVRALDINGMALFLPGNTPLISLGNSSNLTILHTGTITGSRDKQVIALLPNDVLTGNYLMSYSNKSAAVNMWITLNSPFPRSAIIMWPNATPPAGWSICDGTGGNVDPRNKFIVSAGSQYAVGATGGRATIAGHSLSKAEIPSHNHNYQDRTATTHLGSGPVLTDHGSNARSTSSVGGGQAHSHGDNRPPYYALNFICKN